MTERNQRNLTKAQEKAQTFLHEHKIEKIVSEMLNSLVHAKDPQPIIFMIKYLANLVSEQELSDNGVSVSGPLPQRIPIVTYPKFDENCNSLLKKHLSREIWSNMKKKNTSKGGNIQICVKSGVHITTDPIGVMATDEEAYKTFSDLFGPIIKDLHPRFDFRYSYKFEEPTLASFDKRLAEMEYYVERCETMQIRMNRNFRGMPFSPLMTKEAKLQIERKVVEVLGELYGQYHQINRIDDKTEEYLHSLGVNIHRTPLHDAAGINDDYPVGRGVFIEDSHEFLVLVNFEDHVEIVLLPEKHKKDSLRRCLSRLAKLNQTFDKIGYATDAYLGHLTVSPANLGTGMSMRATIRLDAGKMNPPYGGPHLKEMLLEKLPNQRLIKIGVRNNVNSNSILVDIATTQTLAPNYYEIIQINDFLWAVESIAEFDVKGGNAFREMPSLTVNESQSRLDQPSVSEVIDDDQSQELMEDESRSR